MDNRLDIRVLPIDLEELVYILQSTTDIVALATVDGPVLFLNDAGHRMLSIPKDEADFWLMHFHPEEEQTRLMNEILPAAVRDGSWQGETIMETQDGQQLHLLHTIVAHYDQEGNNTFVSTIARDITPQKQAERELAEYRSHLEQVVEQRTEKLKGSEQKFRSIFERNIAGVYRCLVDGVVLECNNAFAQIFDVPNAQEMLGKKSSSLYFEPAEREQYITDLTRDSVLTNYEMRHKTFDDREVWVLVNARLAEDEKGNPVIEGTMFDITSQHKLREELNETNQQLRDLSRHLQSVREEEAKRIARDLHDELGQVLTALKFEVSLLSKKINDVEVDTTLMNEKIESMKSLIQQSMDSVRSLSTNLRPSTLDNMGLFDAMELHLEAFEARTNIKFQLTGDHEGLDNLPEDIRVSVFRIIQEALTNIARHANAKKVYVTLENEEDALHVSIRDDGKGILPQELSKSRSHGIMGMRERVLSLNGKIDISGKKGQGTAITIQIPKHS